jgi:hypothetical protein
MTENTEILSDFNYLYRNNQKFFPIIQESVLDFHSHDACNAVVIKLSAKPSDELVWAKQSAYAQKVREEGKLILWELDFDVTHNQINSADSSTFYSLGIAIDEFVASLWREYQDISIGVILYRGDVNFCNHFVWNDEHKALFLEKITDPQIKQKLDHLVVEQGDDWALSLSENRLFQLFAADVFAEYFQRLVSYLPDTLLAFALLDVSEEESSAFLAQLLSRDRFQHILLGLKKSKIPAGHLNWEEGVCLAGWVGQGSPYFSAVFELNLAVCLPLDEGFNSSVYHELDSLFADLGSRQIPYRIIPENLLTEAWDGIDAIVVLSQSVSYQGKRRLQGFCAAGGRVICIGPSLGLPEEMAFDTFKLELPLQEVLI